MLPCVWQDDPGQALQDRPQGRSRRAPSWGIPALHLPWGAVTPWGPRVSQARPGFATSATGLYKVRMRKWMAGTQHTTDTQILKECTVYEGTVSQDPHEPVKSRARMTLQTSNLKEGKKHMGVTCVLHTHTHIHTNVSTPKEFSFRKKADPTISVARKL